MSESTAANVVERLGARLRAKDLGDDVNLVYRVTGGPPGRRIERTVMVSGSGRWLVRLRDDLNPERSGEASGDGDAELPAALGELIRRGVPELVPRAEARFEPDSMVGSVSIGIGDEQAEYFFALDPTVSEVTAKGLAASAGSLVEEFERVASARLVASGDKRTGRAG